MQLITGHGRTLTKLNLADNHLTPYQLTAALLLPRIEDLNIAGNQLVDVKALSHAKPLNGEPFTIRVLVKLIRANPFLTSLDLPEIELPTQAIEILTAAINSHPLLGDVSGHKVLVDASDSTIEPKEKLGAYIQSLHQYHDLLQMMASELGIEPTATVYCPLK